MAPIVRLLAQTAGVESRVCVTAQHRQMLDQVLSLFEVKPDYDLDLMRDDQSLAQLSAAIFTNLDPVFTDFKPDWVLAQGDTTTVAMTSLLAYYHRIKFGHVEAGLRTHDKWQPFPEEINRRVAGVTADLHFAPTEWSKQNLLREGIAESIIKVTGNTVIDALQYVSRKPEPAEITQLITRLLRRLGLDTSEKNTRSTRLAAPDNDMNRELAAAIIELYNLLFAEGAKKHMDERTVYEVFDTDANKHLTREEFNRGLIKLRIKLSEQQVNEIILFADKDKNNAISLAEFLDAIKTVRTRLDVSKTGKAAGESKKGDGKYSEALMKVRKFAEKSRNDVISFEYKFQLLDNADEGVLPIDLFEQALRDLKIGLKEEEIK